MRRLSASDVVLRVLGLLLLIAAVLKGHELLTVPVANESLWSWRPLLIFQVEFELALGIWLLSGVFKRLAWLAALTCFGLFCCVTLYKGLTGAPSCGCFGRIHVNPWVTLTAVDLPAVIALTLIRPAWCFGPQLISLRNLRSILISGRESMHAAIKNFVAPVAPVSRLFVTAGLALVTLGATTPILALSRPALITASYEVLEPETWIGKELPILRYIDIAEQLKKGTWLLLFYHHDCPHCQEAIPQYEQIARDLAGNADLLRLAVIEVPPYRQIPASLASSCVSGHLAEAKEWFVATPSVLITHQGLVRHVWEGKVPDLSAIAYAM